eukprot:Pgem_evm1s12528
MFWIKQTTYFVIIANFAILFSYCQATCDQKLLNSLQHLRYGNLTASVNNKRCNAAGWDQEPQDIAHGASNVYKVKHHIWAQTNVLWAKVNYTLLDSDNQKIANIEVWNSCNSREHKTQNYISWCRAEKDEDKDICNDIGLKNVKCE